MKIDAHQHFWIFDPVRDSWITPDMQVIQRNFLPKDLKAEMDNAGIDGCVSVQASQSEEENTFLLAFAAQHKFIKGIVGWVDLRAPNIEERLSFYAEHKKIKGFRHVLQGEADRAMMLAQGFMNGISKLAQSGFTYDILIFPDQLPYAVQLAKAFPHQKFIVDHLAKPYVKKGEMEPWKKNMAQLAELENVYCKVSGMITEANWQQWQPSHLVPYLDAVWEGFGSRRLLFGSDYPVCLVAGSYQRWVSVLQDYTAKLSADEQADFWGKNAVSFYNLETT